jgi:hypothetical protein
MRTVAVNTAALALLVSGSALVFGQPGAEPAKAPGQEKAPPAKSKLEEMLAQALKNNPDIRVAAAKLGEAEAELNRVRLQVMQKVVTLYHTTEMARSDVATAERTLARIRELGPAVSREELDAAQAALAAAKAKLAAVEAEVPYVIGKQPPVGDVDAATLRGLLFLSRMQAAGGRKADLSNTQFALFGLEAARRPVQGPLADRIRKALDTPVSLRVTDGSVADVLRLLREQEPGLTIKYVPRQGAGPKLTFEMKDLPLGAALEYLQDSLTDYVIVMREYGLLLTVEDRAPPGAVSLHDFWKKGHGQVTTEAKNPPAKDVEGVIKRVDAGSGLVTVSVGSDAGLVKGNTLEVFRTTAPTPKYMGTIQVLEVSPREAVCRPVGRMPGVPSVGDRVASRLKEK